MIKIALYIASFLILIALRNKEQILALVHLGILGLIIMILTPPEQRVWLFTTAVGISALMSALLYICTKHFGMFGFKNTKFTIPMWLPVLWAITVVFIHDVLAATNGQMNKIQVGY